MPNLLEEIFSNFKVNNLNKKEVHQHLTYLNEIIRQERSKKRVLQNRHWRARLFWQLIKVNRKTSQKILVKTYPPKPDQL